MFGTFTEFFLAQDPMLGGGSSTVQGTDIMVGLQNVGLFVLAVIVPFVLGKLLSTQLKMPTQSMAFSWILLSIIVTSLVLATGTLPMGPDIKGGTNFIYEIDRSSMDPKGPRIVAKQFLDPLSRRLNPSGTNETIVRPIGDDKVEIIIAAVDPASIEQVKRTITNAGILQFRIVANSKDHENIIKRAIEQSENSNQNIRLRRDVYVTNKTTNEEEVAGVWRKLGLGVEVDGVRQVQGYQAGDTIRDARTGRILKPLLTGKKNDFENWLKKENVAEVDILLALQRRGEVYTQVDGVDLDRANKAFGKNGSYEVSFTMKTAGAVKMLALTGANQPELNNDFKRRMAILLDNEVLSAPSLNSPIRGEGVIQGNFSESEVDFLVNILNSGALPGAISKTPISQHIVGASMGKDAINKAGWASAASLVVTILCVVFYYRFSGGIATIALLLNLAMIVAVMMLIRQPLTLAGLAGLVLSVGMSVDANVLVFERIREEMERKATPRMAIRNGFDRAWTTIFDSNLTTLISAIVLYWVGTEQIKGFAITLIIGLAISLFTAVFFTHKLFEIAERWKFAWLGMSDYVNTARRSLFGDRDIDFLSSRYICYGISGAIIVVGLIATVMRGSQILDIDFNGGTSVVITFNKGLEPDEVRKITNKVFDEDKNGLPIQTSLTSVNMNEFEKDSVYKIDISLRDPKDVTERIVKGFSNESGASLVTYDMESKLLGSTGANLKRGDTGVRLVSFQDPAPAATTPPADTPAPPATAPAATEDKDVAVATPTVSAPAKQSVSTLELNFKSSTGNAPTALTASQLSEALINGATAAGLTLVDAQIEMLPNNAESWTRESSKAYSSWNVKLPFDATESQLIADKMKQELRSKPVFQSISTIEGRVAGEMQQRAIGGLLLSLVFITAYIWFRFNRVAYGIAAVIALVHDVLITIAFIAISHWLFKPLGFLLIEDFKISLTIVAAILTIIGYSLNDTIVVFDRIREVKGKSPNLTEKMINTSVTQTLSRTLLTSSTTIVAILLMYIFGGEGIHGFAFCLLIGILVGTYSSIFVAAPILLWLAKREQEAKLASKVM